MSRNLTQQNNTHQYSKSDIALIEIEKVKISETIWPACLHTYWVDLDTSEVLTYSDFKQNDFDLMTVPFEKCHSDYRKIYNRTNVIDETQYCAYDPTGNSDICHGNAGAPLQIFTANSTLATVVGILSFNYENETSSSCSEAAPTVFTRIASYIPWIEKYVWPQTNSTVPNKNNNTAFLLDKIRTIHQ